MLEKSYEIKIKNIKFKIRIDRVDRIDGNNKLLIDYKTGKNVISRKALFSNDLTDLQLPIYACFTSINGLSGVAIGHINRGKINLYGVLSSDNNTISKQLSSKIDNSAIKDWHSLTNLWRNKIENIVEQYLSGNAAVTFDENIDFAYCDILPLLRLAEKKYQFEFYG
jgi:exodeoxyribonuclease-5